MERTERSRFNWILAVLLLALLPIAGWTIRSLAAAAPRVENPHGTFKEECAHCHTSSSWKISRVSSSFDHTRYGFPLAGAHASAACTACHKSLDFTQAKTQCVSCHQDPHRGEMGTECARCHGSRSFTDRGPMVRAHQLTKFPLTGSHAAIDCESCHKATQQGHMQFVGTQADCKGCHMPQFQSAKNPDHVAGGFPQECQTCHATVGWTPARFNHDLTAFPLTGAHRATACAQCHTNGQHAGTPKDCASCHQADYNRATPSHAASGFPANACAGCHTTTTFSGASFDHNTTSFPLTGSHRTAACNSCHGDGVYNNKPTACISCHTTEYNGNASHRATPAAFPQAACASCHNTTSFAGAVFDHNTTSFALTGSHRTAACTSCHGDGVYAGKPTTCISCHSADYNGNASHRATPAAFPTGSCASCHNTTSFSGAVFDHNTTAFALTGSHRTAACTSCHGDGVYAGKPTTCISCHGTDYSAATPTHTPSAFPQTACASCHNTTSFAGATFDHSTTAFPLTGSHRTAACNTCHGDGVYAGKPTTCISCHGTDYSSATPTHTPAAFPQSACASCHNTTSFSGASFDHNTTTFPLTGAHRTVTCQSCHGDGVYIGKPTACFSCHSSDYSSAVPPHNATSFPQASCTTCHTTTAWSPATFNHSTTSFPLTGAHVATACAGCHSDGVYDGRSTACQSCHMTDYNTADPNHTAAGFAASACATCHNTTQWAGATFNHDGSYFPIYSGKHKGKWSTCQQCHTNSNNYAVFTCLSCHPHDNKSNTDSQHSGRSGYSYDSAACYRCHPRGSS